MILDRMKDGIYAKYRINGKMKIHYEIRDGKLQVYRTHYYMNVKLSFNLQFDKGEFNGTNSM